MSVFMIFRVALKALNRNKMRTALTMLGMIIGVAAVITMVALGTGRAGVDRGADPDGRHQHDHRHGRQLHAGRRPAGPGQRQHADARRCGGDREAAGRAVRGGGREHARADRRRQPELEHAAPGHRRRLPADPLVADRGRARSSRRSDVTTAAKVVVLGSVVRDQLFGPDVDPIGQVIRIQNQPFTIVGVLARRASPACGQDQDDVVFAPVHDRA